VVVLIAIAVTTTLVAFASPRALVRKGEPFQWRRDGFGWFRLWQLAIFVFGAVFIVAHFWGVPGAALSGLVIDAGYFWAARRRVRTARTLLRLLGELERHPSEPAVAALDAEIQRLRQVVEERSADYRAWATWTLYAVSKAYTKGQLEAAARWAESIDRLRLGDDASGVQAYWAAASRIALGDRKAAREHIASARRPAKPPMYESILSALEALLDALDGPAPSVLPRIDRALAGSLDPQARPVWLASRAHALHATGAEGECRELLRKLHAEHGDLVLQRIVRHQGPASEAAAALLASSGPYR
jgi:hypothetical protein